MSAECSKCGSDLNYDLSCSRCGWQLRAENAESAEEDANTVIQALSEQLGRVRAEKDEIRAEQQSAQHRATEARQDTRECEAERDEARMALAGLLDFLEIPDYIYMRDVQKARRARTDAETVLSKQAARFPRTVFDR